MTETQRTVAQEIERYLRTGESDPYRSAWSGGFLQREERAHDDLRNALVREIRRLTAGLSQEPLPESDTVSLTREKVEPMVRGLFPKVEQDLVLAMLERSVIFVTGANIESLRLECSLRWLCVDAREPVRRKRWRGVAWEDRATTTTHGYIEADLRMKEQALKAVAAPVTRGARFKAKDDLLRFLEGL